ncbi:AbrB/MazE/SpoVT family DNA-binding domain-containing protein [Patulibacter defluvii]|uniref:AbrB/MazE/SpoVT family DNA-binding domain-containing protein n=1 Tax=Patulibacter defluvii TaxID=3095358 RepID=UPI002A755019|nr:AbrB/MazE/SpoVT family DNA-binding domain-containing protein [Patulibacter sp. DM4]
MSTAKVYSKGQVTIPKAVREAAGIDIGDRVVIEARGDEVVLHRARGVLEFQPPQAAAPAARPWPEVRQAAREDRAARRTAEPS